MTRYIIGMVILSLMSASLFAFNDSLLPQVQIGEPGKNVGDIISPATRMEVAAWCDFNKQIVMVFGVYVCSYNGNKVGQ